MYAVFTVVFAVYLFCTIGLLIYGLNCYVMIALFARRRRQARDSTVDARYRAMVGGCDVSRGSI